MNIDWQDGHWRKDAATSVDARIMVTGDWAPVWQYESIVLSDPPAVYGNLLAELRRSDLTITNLECALGEVGSPIFKAGPNIRAKAGGLAGLTAVPFHVAAMANNHVFDYGLEGLLETQRLVHGAGIKTFGAGTSEREAWTPLVVKVGAARVGMFGFAEGEDSTAASGDRPGVAGWNVERAIRTIKELRSQVDVLLVVCHAGREHPPLPPPWLVAAYRRVAEAGADALIAHHPHVPQGFEIHQGVPIVYSTGNFVFHNGPNSFYRKSGYMVELELAGRRLAGLRLHPYLLGPQGLRLLEGDERRFFLGRLRYVSELLADPAAIRAAWEAFIDFTQSGGEFSMTEFLGLILEGWKENRPLWAARLRNLLVAPSSRELWTDATTRIITERMGTAPEWARELVKEWTSLSIEDALRC